MDTLLHVLEGSESDDRQEQEGVLTEPLSSTRSERFGHWILHVEEKAKQ